MTSSSGLTGEEDLAAELFGDFDSQDEPSPASQSQPSGQRRVRPAGEVASTSLTGASLAASSASAGEPPKKKKRKDKEGAASKFFELEAEEAGASSDEEDEADLDGLIDDSAAPASREKLQQAMNAEAQEAEGLAAELKAAKGIGEEGGARRVFGTSFLDKMEEKYKDLEEATGGLDLDAASGPPASQSPVGSHFEKKDSTAFVVPAPNDPKLWCCKTFAPERDLCISLMIKAGEQMAQGTRVPVYSIFFSPHLRGYLYMEAFKESDVRDFCKGIRGISPWAIQIVPTAQMPMVFMSAVVDADKRTLVKPGDWVRMRRALYKGDLGQVDEVKDDEFVIKIKPRLQFGLESAKKQERGDREARQRPPPRWFNRGDLEAGDVVVNTEKRFSPRGYLTFFLVDQEVYRDGFLYKKFKNGYFDSGDKVRPQEHELQDWRFAPPITENTRPAADIEKVDQKQLMPPPSIVPKKSLVAERYPIMEGDVVIVATGDLKNLRAKVMESLFGAPTVFVKPLDVNNIKSLNLAVNLLCKWFQVGDYVKVVAGDHEGDVGYVVKVVLDDKGNWSYNATARVVSTSITAEFTVRLDHIRLTNQKADPSDLAGEFRTEQLVTINQTNRGMIIRIEAGSRAMVLTTDGRRDTYSLGDLAPVDLPKKKDYGKLVWTADRNGRRIAPGCLVNSPRTNVKTAPVKAEVLFIHMNFCFMKAVEMYSGDRAYIVCGGDRVEYIYSIAEETDKQRKPRELENAPIPFKPGAIQYGVTMASETSWIKPWVKDMLGLQENTGSNLDITLKGSAVRITGGGYKGLRGEIRDNLGETVLISLLSKPKLVVVPITSIAPDDYVAQPKSTRFTLVEAPGTPPLVMSPGSPVGLVAPGTPLADEAGELVKRQPTEEDIWNPMYLMESPEVAALADGRASASDNEKPAEKRDLPPEVKAIMEAESPRSLPSATQAPVALEPTQVPPASPVEVELSPASPVSESGLPPDFGQMPGLPGAKRRKREPRFPGAEEHSFTPLSLSVDTPKKAGSDGKAPIFSSPTSDFNAADLAPGVAKSHGRVPWLIEGLGVKYMHNGLTCHGWIIKVYDTQKGDLPDTHVVPDGAAVGVAPIPMKGNATRPWLCEERGDKIMVFDGPHRGTKGKVIGFEKSQAFIQVDFGSQGRRGLSCAARHMVKPEKEEVARYSEAILKRPLTSSMPAKTAPADATKAPADKSEAESPVAEANLATAVGEAKEVESPADSPSEAAKESVQDSESPHDNVPTPTEKQEDNVPTPTAPAALEKEEVAPDGQAAGEASDID